MKGFFRDLACAIVVFGALAITHRWMLDYPLILDDYVRLEEAEAFDRTDFLLGGTRDPHTVFRPMLWGTQRLDHALWNWWLPGYHLSSILWHALTCLLLWIVVRAWAGEKHWFFAAAAAGIFAVHPAKYEAVAWIAARGSLLPAPLGLLAMLLLARRWQGRRIPLVAPVGFLLLAFLSKESSVGLAGAVLVGAALAPGLQRIRRLDVGVLLLLPLVLWGGRRLLLGADATRYMGWYLQLDEATLLDTLGTLPDILLAALVGPLAAGEAPLAVTWGVSIVFMLGVLGCLRTRRSLLVAAALACAFLVIALPVAFVSRAITVPDGELKFVSRLTYPVTMLSSILLAAPLLMLRRKTPMSLLGGLCGVVVLIMLGRGILAETQRFSVHEDEERRFRTRLAAAAEDAPGAVVAVEATPPHLVGLTWGYFREPFHRETVRVEAFHRTRIEELHRLLERGVAVKLVRWNGRDLDVSPVVSRPAAFAPFDVSADGGTRRFDLPRIAPRAMPAFALHLRQASPGRSLFDVVLVDEAGREILFPSGRDPDFIRTGPLLFALDDRVEILELAPLVAIELRMKEGPDIVMTGFETVAALPRIDVQSPEADAVIRSDSPERLVRFRDPGEHPIIRLGFRLADHVWSTTVWRSTCVDLGDGILGLPMDAPDVFRGGGKSVRTLLTELGVERLEIFWWVEGLDGQIFHRSARSDVRRLTVVR